MTRKLKLLCALVISGAAIAGVAYAASSPTVATGSTSSITTSSVVLHATVNPNGAKTSVHFDYGLTNQYGSSTSNKTVNGSKTVSVTVKASGLLPGTVYHYRVVATNRFGTTSGSDRQFKTAGNPPPDAATGGTANVTTNSATLAGVVNPHGAKTTYAFQWGLTTTYTYSTQPAAVPAGNAPVIVAQTLTGLQPGTLFHYRIVAFHGSTVFAAGADATFITEPSPRPAPRISKHTTPRHDSKRPYTFTVSGKVSGSSRFPATLNCVGNVTVRFSLGKRTVSRTVVPLKPDCTFSTQTTFRHAPGRGKNRTPERLGVHVSFGGNGYVAPGSARTGSVIVG
jgi:hypothetical protein